LKLEGPKLNGSGHEYPENVEKLSSVLSELTTLERSTRARAELLHHAQASLPKSDGSQGANLLVGSLGTTFDAEGQELNATIEEVTKEAEGILKAAKLESEAQRKKLFLNATKVTKEAGGILKAAKIEAEAPHENKKLKSEQPATSDETARRQSRFLQARTNTDVSVDKMTEEALNILGRA